jgi:hypothetical protein
MSDEERTSPPHSAQDRLAEDPGFSPFSDAEVKCETCGMNIVREREAMSKHRDFHAAAGAPASEGEPS